MLNMACPLQIGEPLSEELTMDEIRSHFALWAIAKSPLFISADLRYNSLQKPFLVWPLPPLGLFLSQGRQSSMSHLQKQRKRKDANQMMHGLCADK